MALINRINRVPMYQRLYQKHDNVRLWWKGPRSGMILYPYFFFFGASLAGTTYGMIRMSLGYKTWFGQK